MKYPCTLSYILMNIAFNVPHTLKHMREVRSNMCHLTVYVLGQEDLGACFVDRKVANSSTPCLEAHPRFYRLSGRGKSKCIYCDLF